MFKHEWDLFFRINDARWGYMLLVAEQGQGLVWDATVGQDRQVSLLAVHKNTLINITVRSSSSAEDTNDGTEELGVRLQRARDLIGARLIVFPELTLSGYLAEDLILRPSFIRTCDDYLAQIAGRVHGIDLIVGHPVQEGDRRYNALSWIRDGDVLVRYRKQALPNYTVFDEKRYFTAGDQAATVDLDGVRFAPLICEDIWDPQPAQRALQVGADALIVINASPFNPRNRIDRHTVVSWRAREHDVPIAYVNLVAGQDDLVFDGGAFVVDRDGQIAGPAPAFEDHLLALDYDIAARRYLPVNWPVCETSDDARVYNALVRGTRDYVQKNRFPGVLLGLSGGVDSALTLALAVDALGPEQVTAVMMPTRYTSQLSLDEAAAQARLLGVKYHVAQILSLIHI